MKKITALILILCLLIGIPVYAEGDIPASWAEESVNELKATNEFRKEVFSKYSENITRLDFIYLAVRLYEVLDGKEIVVNENISFTDTDDIYALKGATVGITSGVGNGKFGADNLLTREQLAVLMINVIELLEIEMIQPDNEKFVDDNEISSWAKTAIYKAKANGIISGVGQGKVAPSGNASTQVAIIITNNLLNNFGQDITPSTPVEGQVNVGDIEGGYEAKEMSIDSVTKLGSWVNNDYSKAEMNPNGDYASDLELLDEMLQSGGIDISSTGSIQMQGKDDEFSNDAYAKVKVKTNSKGQVYLEIRGWAYKDYQRNFPEFVLAMNGTREVLKYYSASNADAEAIYAYIDNAIKITPTNDLEKVKTFGNTKIILSDPGVFGYDVIFVN